MLFLLCGLHKKCVSVINPEHSQMTDYNGTIRTSKRNLYDQETVTGASAMP